MCGEVIPSVTVYKELGVWWSGDLSTTKHTSSAISSASQSIYMLKRCFSSRLSPFARKLLYQSFVKPHLEYGVSAIFPRTRGELNRLIRVERWYTRMATIRPAPYYNRLHSLGLLPLRSRFLEKDVRWLWNEFRAKCYFLSGFVTFGGVHRDCVVRTLWRSSEAAGFNVCKHYPRGSQMYGISCRARLSTHHQHVILRNVSEPGL